MRILLVMEATVGGTRRHLVDLAQGLHRRGQEVHVAASAERSPDFREDLTRLARVGIGVTEVPMSRSVKPGRDAQHTAALRRLLKDLRPDVVHTHSSKAGAVGRLASWSTGIGARVHTPHTFAFLFGGMFSAGQKAFYRTVEGWLCKRTDRVIAVSDTEAQAVVDSGVIGPDRVVVVPNGIDPAPWMDVPGDGRAEFGLPEGVPLGALVGLMNLAKGQDLALLALARPENRDLHLVFAGTGETEPELRELAERLGIEDRAHFLGWCEDVPRLLACCDMLILPSRWEGMPYVVLEAMAAGLPVVVTAVHGARELVESSGAGYVVALEDAGALAYAMGQVLALGPEQRRVMGARGRRRVLADFDLANMISRTLEVYREVT
jgi:glycosyltransferase involved in cell wall biosynthesis